MSKKQYKNILIIKPSALGDIALSLSALASLKKSFPEAKITWFVRTGFASLLDAACDLDEKILFDRKFLGKWWRDPKAFAELMRMFKQLRNGRFDLVIDLQGLFRTAFFGWLTGCKCRYGLKGAREFAGLFYSQKVARPQNSLHLKDWYAEVVAAAGAEQITFESNFSASPKASDVVGNLLAENSLAAGKYVVFIPGAAHDNKCWPIDKFAVLAEKIKADFDLPIVIAGGPKEKPLAEKIKSTAKVSVVDLVGATDIPELVALLDKSRLVVSNDTGPGHIAVALGRDVVMIFGPTNPARICPYGCGNAVAAIDADTRGSGIENSNPDHVIEKVTVDMVYEKVAAQLKS